MSRVNKKTKGRKPHPHNRYDQWLEDLKPFLKQGSSLNFAIEKSGLSKHKDSIYRKYREKGEFCEKIDTFRKYPGELVNSLFARIVQKIENKINRRKPLSSEEYRTLRWYATKHRSAQLFFTNHEEVIEKSDDEIVTVLDKLESSYQELADKAKVTINSPATPSL